MVSTCLHSNREVDLTTFFEIHSIEKMPIFRPHSESCKFTKTVNGRKSGRPRKSWIAEVQQLMGFGPVGMREIS